MAAKLTFEAKMQGMEQVLDLLKRAEERMNDFGRVGSYSLEGVDKRLKEFQQSLEFINKSQSGMGGIFKSFDELNRRSNEFLGKSYRGIIDGMKQEVKAFETEADKVLNRIKELDNAQEALKSKRASMGEQAYHEQEHQNKKELDLLRSNGVAINAEKLALQKQLFYAQPMHEGLHAFASKYGMGNMATVGGGLMAATYMAQGPMMAGMAMNAAGGYGMQFNFTKDADAALATARLQRSAAAQAMSFDPTTYLLQSMGGGIEGPGMDSWSMRAKATGRHWMDNPFVAGIAGAGMGAGAGFIAGSAIPIIGNVAGTVGGALYGGYRGFTGAGNKSYEEIIAEERAGLRNRDLEMYGILGKGAAAQVQRESTELMTLQRIYGIEGTHNLSMNLAAGGISPDRANPMLNMMISQGMLPGNYLGNSVTGFDMADTNNMFNRFSLNENFQRAAMRNAALNGTSLISSTRSSMGLFGSAGVTGVGDIAARGNLGDYAASLAANRGFGSTDLGTAGSAVAANVAANSPGFNKVEGVQQGIANYEAQTNLLQGGSSALDTIMISKLRMLGVTNAVVISAFLKLDPRLPSTQEKIAAYTGKSKKEVAEAITGGFQAYNNMYESVVGKDQSDRFKKTTGVDLQTLLQSGVRAGENTAGGGATFRQGLEASGAGAPGNPGAVGQGQETFMDKQNKAVADQTLAIDEKMREILAGTGKTVTDEITKAIVKGFEVTSQEVKKAADKIIADKGGTPVAGDVGGVGNILKPPYLGPKENKESQ